MSTPSSRSYWRHERKMERVRPYYDLVFIGLCGFGLFKGAKWLFTAPVPPPPTPPRAP